MAMSCFSAFKDMNKVVFTAVVTTQRAENGTCQVENAFLVALSIQMYQTSLSDLMVHAMYRFVSYLQSFTKRPILV